VTPEDYDILIQAIWNLNVKKELETLKVPTLVLNPRVSPDYPPNEAVKEVASLIPDARFSTIDSAYLMGNAAQGLAAIDAFVAQLPSAAGQVSAPALDQLSKRQLEILRLLADGKTNSEIAAELVISQRTVERHVSDIYARLAVRNRAEASSYWHQNFSRQT